MTHIDGSSVAICELVPPQIAVRTAFIQRRLYMKISLKKLKKTTDTNIDGKYVGHFVVGAILDLNFIIVYSTSH